MIITLKLFLLFVLEINSGVITTSSPFNASEELNKIKKTCLTDEEHYEISGNKFEQGWARELNRVTIEQALFIIGCSEIRKALGFPKYLGSWQNHGMPKIEEIEDAPSLEKYFELQILYSISRSAELFFVTDQDLSTAIQFLDKRFPAIRMVFREKFEKYLETMKANNKSINRNTIDYLLIENEMIQRMVKDATGVMFYSRKCTKYSIPDTSFLYLKTVKECLQRKTCSC
ncbi:unnamed protein product [Caenorhabditis angaria]|uniref:Uncharacterized protein n=1 Tax=Caenorhabditis angaria TaxID=860376 RepID=A0A9P1IPS2_9PELO|nr:unnamed protein product [Caenorhabditis angaria]